MRDRQADVRADLVGGLGHPAGGVPRAVAQPFCPEQDRVDDDQVVAHCQPRVDDREVPGRVGVVGVADDLEQLDRLRVLDAEDPALGVALVEEVLGDLQVPAELQAYGRVARHLGIRRDRRVAAKGARRDGPQVVVEGRRGVGELLGADLPRDQQARLQGVGVGAEEVVQDLVVTLVGSGVPLVLDVWPDEHVGLMERDDLCAVQGLEAVDVHQLAVLDSQQLNPLGGVGAGGRAAPRPATALEAGSEGSEQKEGVPAAQQAGLDGWHDHNVPWKGRVAQDYGLGPPDNTRGQEAHQSPREPMRGIVAGWLAVSEKAHLGTLASGVSLELIPADRAILSASSISMSIARTSVSSTTMRNPPIW